MLNGYGESPSPGSYGPAFLRLAIGAVFIAHGGQKLFGGWGGGGNTGTTASISQLGLESAGPLAVAVGSVEFVGGILLVAGAFTLIASIALAFEASAAILQAHLAGGFLLNWPLTPAVGHGYDFQLTLIGALVCLMLTGPGAMSFDARRASHAAAEAAGRARLRAGTV